MTGRRSAVVTGATRGIGRAVARSLAAGHRVIMLARNADDLQAVAHEIGDDAHPLPCDLGDSAATEAAIERICELTSGVPDLLVNNASLF